MGETSAGVMHSPYLLWARARVCDCTLPARELAKGPNRDRIEAIARGYWNVLVAFYGEQQLVIRLEIVDRRDGRIVWRDGRAIDKGGSNGKR